uniref:DDE Tnp4 domain-containing protein n=1 Tax=Macrostomum lignano TaxID=282301 RepID=A0A1I8FAV3_9PLAT
SSVKKSCTSDSSKCRCVHYTELSTAFFHRQSCSTKQSYLCSCAVGGDSKFYSLFSEDEDKTSRAWIVGVVFCSHFCFRYVGGCRTKIKQKLTIRRSISAANGRTLSRQRCHSNNLYPGAAGAAVIQLRWQLRRAIRRATTKLQAVDRYGCTHRTGRPAIVSINSSAYKRHHTRFSVELNLVNISYCHAEFHGVGGMYFYVRLSSSLSKRLSVFRHRPDIVLDVELVKTGACPAGWLYRDGLCYGAAHPNNSRATFTNAAVGCRYVRANLALGFVSSTADVLGLASTTTWPTVKIPGLIQQLHNVQGFEYVHLLWRELPLCVL